MQMTSKVTNRLFVFGFIVISVVLLVSLLLLQLLVSIISIQKPILLFVQASSSSQSSITTTQNNDDGDDDDDEADNSLSTYENPILGFNIKYPTDYRIAEVSNSPASKTVTFEKLPFTPGTSGAGFLSLTVDKEVKAMTLDKLKKLISDSIKINPGTLILENTATTITGIPAHKIVQSHENSPFGRDAIAIFLGVIRNNTSYTISSLSTDKEALQEMINSFEIRRR
jgi:PsbP-like protein